MSAIKCLTLICSVVLLSACSSISETSAKSEASVNSDQPAVVIEKAVIAKKPKIVEYSGIELWSSCLHYIVIRNDKFVGYQPRYFNFDESEPIEKAEKKMQCISDLLKDYPNQAIEIRGYADTTGTERYNLLLSAKRSAFVVKELLTLGVANKQLASIAMGESEPVNKNSTEEERNLNRRVEFVLIKTP